MLGVRFSYSFPSLLKWVIEPLLNVIAIFSSEGWHAYISKDLPRLWSPTVRPDTNTACVSLRLCSSGSFCPFKMSLTLTKWSLQVFAELHWVTFPPGILPCPSFHGHFVVLSCRLVITFFIRVSYWILIILTDMISAHSTNKKKHKRA